MNKERYEYLEKFGILETGKLGSLSNDEKDFKSKIYYGMWINPKTYFVKMLGNDNKIRIMKKKAGQPRDQLTIEHFENVLFNDMPNEEIKRNVFKKTGLSRVTGEQPFTIQSDILTRKFCEELYSGRQFEPETKERVSFPYGFDETKKQFYLLSYDAEEAKKQLKLTFDINKN